jgi:hypothetical protein
MLLLVLGCMCAAVFAKELLQIPDGAFYEYEKITTKPSFAGFTQGPLASFKPGFCRLSFNYFISHEEMDYLLDALEWIGENSLKMLTYYDYSYKSGSWKCRRHQRSHTASLLAQTQEKSSETVDLPSSFMKDNFEFARSLISSQGKDEILPDVFDEQDVKLIVSRNKHIQRMRWFILPSDVST